MIRGFEEETCPLNEIELSIAHKIEPFLKKKIGKKNIITNAKMVAGINKTYSVNITASRMRKIINYLRTYNIVKCLIATNRGYYIAEKQEELNDYIISLEERASAILEVAKTLKKQKV